MRRAALILAVLALLAAAGGTGFTPLAAAAAPRASLTDIEQDVMCVTCRVPLALADSPQADAERNYIRGLIAKGMTKPRIERALVAQYGEEVLADPPKRGFNLAVWLVPLLVVLAGLAGIAFALPRWRRARAAREAAEAGTADTPAELNAADAARLERELARYD